MPTEIGNSINQTHYRGGLANKRSTLTSRNVCMREVHLRRNLPHDWSTFTMRWFPSNDGNLERKCIAQHEMHLQSKPTQFCRPTTKTTQTMTTTMTTMSSQSRIIMDIAVHLPYWWFSTAISLTAKEATCYIHFVWTAISVLLAVPMALGKTTLWFETTTSRGTTFRTPIGGSNQLIRYG